MVETSEIFTVVRNPYDRIVSEFEYIRGVKEDKEKRQNNLNMAGLLYYGNDNDVEAAAQYFRDNVPNLYDVDRSKDGVILTFNDNGVKTSKTIKFKDSNID